MCLLIGLPSQAQSVFKHHNLRLGLSLTPFYSYRNLKAPSSLQTIVDEFIVQASTSYLPYINEL